MYMHICMYVQMEIVIVGELLNVHLELCRKKIDDNKFLVILSDPDEVTSE